MSLLTSLAFVVGMQAASLCTDEATDRPLWPVPTELAAESAEVAGTATLLCAIAQHESGLRDEVADCRVVGPRGAVTWWQLESRDGWASAELCAVPRLAVRVANGILLMQSHRCPRCTPAFAVRGYASGDGGKGSQAAREILSQWATLSKQIGLVVYPYSTEVPRWY